MKIRTSKVFAVAAAVVVTAVSALYLNSAKAEPKIDAVLENYANIAQAGFEDSLMAAQKLKVAIDRLIAKPTDANLKVARSAWKTSRIPYMQTEVYRFGNKSVDDWEGKVNAWPLDEGLIDYVDGSYGADNPENALYVTNVIANTSLKIGGKSVDAAKITKVLLSDTLHEAGGVEANVATGYHAIEFLLWGQDLNGTGPGAGRRPASDFDTKNCTGGNCDRRVAYLTVVTDLLIDDLADMAKQWSKDGAARVEVLKSGRSGGLSKIFAGLGSLSYGELAGERIKLGVLLHDPEEEHDCFSDNTHNSHFYNIQGIRNVYLGSYTRIDGSKVSGPSVSDLVKQDSKEADSKIRSALEVTIAKATALKARAESVEAYDQMLGQGNADGNGVIMAVVDGLVAQTKAFEGALAALKLDPISFEGSDSLDSPEKVREN
ncbi:MAG: imelysin family protein [Hyphomicrobiaceae bacterium]